MTLARQSDSLLPRTWLELMVLGIMFSMVLLGIVTAYVDKYWFENVYTREDGLVEWATILPLMLVAGICLHRLFTRWAVLPVKEVCTISITGLLCVFAAGEEISWGQRIFNIESSSFFTTHNAQKETNLHNMVVNGVKVNKLIFSQLITVLGALYLVVFPWLYRRKDWVKELANKWAVPVPQFYQIGAILVLMALIALCPSGKNAELLELGATTIFALIVAHPYYQTTSTEFCPPLPGKATTTDTRRAENKSKLTAHQEY